MDLSIFSLLLVVITGAALSAAVWAGGLLIRRRLRGPARMIVMTVVLILWYLQLYPLLTSGSLEPGTELAYRIGVHSIWIWWVWALMRFISRAKQEAGRTNMKTGLYKATGVHRITAEMRKTAERRRSEAASRPTDKHDESGDTRP